VRGLLIFVHFLKPIKVLDIDRYGLRRVKLELIDVFLTRLGRYFRQDSSL
jgi:hypothetical protein